MKKEDLFIAMSDIDPAFLDEAEAFQVKKKKRLVPFIISLAAVFAVIISLAFINEFGGEELLPENHTSNESVQDIENSSQHSQQHNSSGEDNKTEYSPIKGTVLAKAEYPEMVQYPILSETADPDFCNTQEYRQNYEDWREQEYEYLGTEIDSRPVNEFSFALFDKLLSEEDGLNKAVSPVNIYMALSVLAETCGGNTRKQILDALGVTDIEALRENASAIWKKNYMNDGATKSVIANSLWLSDDVKYKKQTVLTIAEKYLSSVHSGKMGTEGYNNMINAWINEQTDGMFSPDVKTGKDTVLAIASTVLFNAKWQSGFFKGETEEGIFHSPSGDKKADFMHRKTQMLYFWGEKYTAVYMDFDMTGRMWFILPDEGFTPEEVMSEKELQDILLLPVNLFYSHKNAARVMVDLYVPAFDISSESRLIDTLSEMGITDVLDPVKADFSPLSDEKSIYLSEAMHNVRVKADEEGVSAAAYTLMLEATGSMPPEEEVLLRFDRPFGFVITHDSETVLFAGVVNEP